MPERDLWRKKLEFFNKELAIAADPEMKFKLILLIEECESKINPQSSHSTLTSLEKIYVKRNHLEEKCYQEIKKNGALLRINATEKMGKTSLIFNIIEYCQQHNMRVVRLSLRAFDLENIQQLESFLQCFCQEVSQALELNISVRDYWRTHGSLNNKSKCTSYFETYILNINKSPVVLAIDDVESLAPYPAVCQDFLSMLRSWYEAKTLIWQNLRLIISYSTEKFIEMQQDSYVSPFNVGLNIELPEFTLEEVQVLANYYKLPEDTQHIKVRVVTNSGCAVEADTAIVIKGLTLYLFPSAFTPNANALNDGFGIAGPEYVKQYKLWVFNRWGENVFYTEDPNIKWTGDQNQSGLYVYKAKVQDIYSRWTEVEGTVMLLR